jgi:hypothetical protein
MPGDPKECRRHAACCAELAVAASTPQLKTTFLGLSKNWEKLAIQLEGAFAKRTYQGGASKSPSMRLNGFVACLFGDDSPRHA